MAMERCRRLRFLHITAAYGSDTQYPPMGPERHEEFDPIHTITFMLKIRWETPGNTDPFLCRSLRVLLIELKVPSEDLSLLWYHDWAGLDRVLDSAAWDGLQKLVVSICVTESDAGGDQHKAVERFLRGRLPACAAQLGFLETRCCGMRLSRFWMSADDAQRCRAARYRSGRRNRAWAERRTSSSTLDTATLSIQAGCTWLTIFRKR